MGAAGEEALLVCGPARRCSRGPTHGMGLHSTSRPRTRSRLSSVWDTSPGAYDTYIRTDSNIVAKQPLMTTGAPASGGPSLSNVDAIFFLGHRDVALDAQQRGELAAFVKDEGKGFVAAHVALTAFESWPEFGDLIGARYDDHPWGVANGTIVNDDSVVPGHEALPGDVPVRRRVLSAEGLLARQEPRAAAPRRGEDAAARRTARKEGDFPLAWAKMYGKGRVFYSSLGHDAATWDNRDIAQMYFEAMKWSLGLTEGDATPRPSQTARLCVRCPRAASTSAAGNQSGSP